MIIWLALCLGLGIAVGFLSAEIVGLPLAPIVAFALVWFARRKGQGFPTLLSYAIGFESVALWVAVPALLPSSFAAPANPGATLAFAGLLLALGLVMAAAAFLPVVRKGQRDERGEQTIAATLTRPYFLVDGYDVSAHSSLGDVQALLEPYDVNPGGPRLFRYDGAELSLKTKAKSPRTPIWKRQVVATEEVIGHAPEQLAEALRRNLGEPLPKRVRRRMKIAPMSTEDLKTAELPQLVNAFIKAYGTLLPWGPFSSR